MPTRKDGPRKLRARVAPAITPLAAPDQEAAAPVVAREAAPAAAPAPKGPRRNAQYPVGVALYPLDAETESWSDWYGREPIEDLAALEEARFALVRLFVSWKVLEPQVGQYDEDALDRLGDVIDSLRDKKLQAIVCFFADDRHAELAEVPWGKKRDPRTDNYLVQREVALVQRIVSRFRSDTSVFAWQLANEAFCSGFETSDALESWTNQLRDAIREMDPDRPITLGADPETLYRATAVDARRAVDLCEFGVSHVTAAYRAYAAEGPITSGPATYLDAFLLRAAGRGKPVLLDDVGVISLDNSPAEEAAALRMSLWSGLTNRGAGAVARRMRDFATERREPYFVDPFETLVGLLDAEGERKPVFEEARKFVRIAAKIDLRRTEPTPERTAIIMPAERFQPLPNLAGLYDPRACLSAFVAVKEAHVPATVAFETDDFGAYSVLIVPSAFTLADSTWVRLAAFVQGGGTLVLSYGGGDAHPAIRELFGIESLGDGGPRAVLSCRVAQQDVLGSLDSFDARLDVPNYALLSGGTATIVATDAQGSPLLTVNQVGQGRAVYIAVPIERTIAQGDPWATPAPVRKLLREVYGAVARAAGCGAPVSCDIAEVEVTLFSGESEDVLVLVNHAPVKVAANLTTERRVASIADVRGGAAVAVAGTFFGVPLEANGAVALRLSYT